MLFSITAILAQPGFGSSSRQDHINNAESLMAQGSYFNASTYYLKALKNKEDIETTYKLANAYRLSRAYQKASKAYASVLEMGEDLKSSYPLLNYYYGKSLMQNGQYDKAQFTLRNFINEYDDKDNAQYTVLAKNMIEGCTFAQTKKEGLVQTKRVLTLDGPVNSKYTEMSPMPYGEDKILFAGIAADELIATRNQAVYSKIYSASISNFNQSSAKNAFSNSVNSKRAHVGNGAFSVDGNRLYHTICERNVQENRVKCQLYLSTKEADTWTESEKLGDAFNADGYTSSTPYVVTDTDGKDLVYYASNRPGGQGGLDIWVTNGDTPTNLGNSINTVGTETTPFMDNSNDKSYLYFSSEGHIGFGGLDVFRATKTNSNNTSWDDITNAGDQINSSADDLYFVAHRTNKKQAYFVSNRVGTKSVSSKTCCDDIFAVDIKVDALASIAGTVFEAKTPLSMVQVDLYDVTNGQRQLVKSVKTNADGSYNFDQLAAEKKYLVAVSKKDYKSDQFEFSTVGLEENKAFENDFYLKKIKIVPVKVTPVSLTLCGTTFSDKGSKGKSPLANVKVEIYKIDSRTQKLSLVKSTYSDNTGNYCSAIPIGYRFKVMATESNHLTVSDYVDLTGYKPKGKDVLKKDLDLILQYKEVGLSFTIENIYYDFDSATLRPESISSIQKIESILNNNPSIIVELGSHTDSKGSENYNQRLSQKRAQSVVDWLVQNGLPSSRLTAKGYGENTPVAANKNPDGSDNPDGRQLNRRTEFKVIGYVKGLR